MHSYHIWATQQSWVASKRHLSPLRSKGIELMSLIETKVSRFEWHCGFVSFCCFVASLFISLFFKLWRQSFIHQPDVFCPNLQTLFLPVNYFCFPRCFVHWVSWESWGCIPYENIQIRLALPFLPKGSYPKILKPLGAIHPRSHQLLLGSRPNKEGCREEQEQQQRRELSVS